jgi:hypothetical protein
MLAVLQMKELSGCKSKDELLLIVRPLHELGFVLAMPSGSLVRIDNDLVADTTAGA